MQVVARQLQIVAFLLPLLQLGDQAGVLDQPVGNGNGIPSGSFPEIGLKDEKQDWRVNFIPALCPDCGWDLEGQRSALVLHCRNCMSSWYPSGEKLTRVQSDSMQNAETCHFHLPFWQITCEISDVALKNYGDLVKAANLPKIIDASVAAREFRFWTPAFKVRAQAFLRLAESFTLVQAQEMLTPALPPERHYAVTLPVEEACESLKVVLASVPPVGLWPEVDRRDMVTLNVGFPFFRR